MSRKKAWILAGIGALIFAQYINSEIPKWLLIGAIAIWFISGDGMSYLNKAWTNVYSLIEGIF